MLYLNTYFIREHVGAFKISDAYDIVDPHNEQLIGVAQEENPWWINLLRMLVDKRQLPTKVVVREGDQNTGKLVFVMKRGVTLFNPKITIFDGNDEEIGYFKSKWFSFGGAFRVFLKGGEEIALVQGDWKGWNFKFMSEGQELGRVTKKWSGLGKELFTSADNYIISIEGESNPSISLLLLAAGLAVDLIFKESS